MPAVLATLVKTYVSSTGTGTVTLGAAVPGFQTPANAGVANNALVSYGIADANSTYESGRGLYNNGTITRGPIWSSAAANAAISLTSQAVIAITVIAEDLQGIYHHASCGGFI